VTDSNRQVIIRVRLLTQSVNFESTEMLKAGLQPRDGRNRNILARGYDGNDLVAGKR
jgi:hypothetical protein